MGDHLVELLVPLLDCPPLLGITPLGGFAPGYFPQSWIS